MLFPILFELLGLVLGATILFSLKLNLKGKLILASVYILSSLLSLYCLNVVGYLLFLEYLVVSNVLLIAIPWLLTYVIYLRVKHKYAKQD